MYSGISGYCGVCLGFLGEFAEGKIILEKGFQNAWKINDKLMTGLVECIIPIYLIGKETETVLLIMHGRPLSSMKKQELNL